MLMCEFGKIEQSLGRIALVDQRSANKASINTNDFEEEKGNC